MKKLMFAMAVAACALGAQADPWTVTIELGTAEYDGYSVWAVNAWNNGTHSPTHVDKNETAPYKGYSGGDYAARLTEAESQTAAAQLAIFGDADTKGTVMYDYGVLCYNYDSLQGLKVGTDGTFSFTSDNGNEQYSWLFILASDEEATYGTDYAVVRAHEYEITDDEYIGGGVTYDKGGDITKAVYTPGSYTLTGDYDLGGNIEITHTGTIAIPEPTSGLLLLLGMAGLCLRRKQK